MGNEALAAELAALKSRLEALERRRSRVRLSALGVVIALGATAAVAQTLTTFAPNTPALASDVNDNFTILAARITALTTAAQTRAELSGLIAFFPTVGAGRCPTGWTEYAPAQGRTIVGLVPAGTVTGTVGTALTNLEDRVHQHQWSYLTSTQDWRSWDNTGQTIEITNWDDGIDGQGTGVYPLARLSAGAISFFTEPRSAQVPYIQLLACRKN